MTGDAKTHEKKTVARYSTSFSRLSSLILKMPEDMRLSLLAHAEQLYGGVERPAPFKIKLTNPWLLFIGFLAGWVFTTLLMVLFAAN